MMMRLFFVGLSLCMACQSKVVHEPQRFVNTTHQEFTLQTECPPGFELTLEGVCRLRTPYLNYQSLHEKGVGGLKTALPPFRDGFTPQQIDLGRYLFFDPLLSGDGTMACSSCHQPEFGFTDRRRQSVGNQGKLLARNAPSLWNSTFMQRLFWDGRAVSYEEQMQSPLFSPDEMNTTPAALENTLNEHPAYRSLFAECFQNQWEGRITLEQVYVALAAFQSSLVSLNSRYDHYVHGYLDALTADELEGFNVFRSFVARCSECHTPPLFSNQQFAAIGTPSPGGWSFDEGAAITMNEPSLRGAFRVPSLRNVGRTAPYMHAGQFSSLRETVQFYNSGRGHALREGEDVKLHWHIWEPRLSSHEIDRLVDFLNALTDESYMPVIPKKLPSGMTPPSPLYDPNTPSL